MIKSTEERDPSCGISIEENKNQNIPDRNMNKSKEKEVVYTEYFSGMATETRHDPAILIQVNHSMCKPY